MVFMLFPKLLQFLRKNKRIFKAILIYLFQDIQRWKLFILNMKEVRNTTPSEVKNYIEKLLSESQLQQMPKMLLYKLRLCFLNYSLHSTFLDVISKKLQSQQKAVLRMRCLILLHIFLSGNIRSESVEKVEDLISFHEGRLQKKMSKLLESDTEHYFQKEFELPYISFLKKLDIWKNNDLTTLETDEISLGFSQLNKIREILQLKNLIFHLARYFPSHEYAFDIYNACLINVKNYWKGICLHIRDISEASLDKGSIDDYEYYFIKEAEMVEEDLIQFAYGHKYCLRLSKQLKFRIIRVLKPQIEALFQQQTKRKSMESTFMSVETKLSKISGVGNLDTSGSSINSETETEQTAKISQIRQSHFEKLNTEQEMQIMQSIKDLQKILVSSV